MHTYYAILFYNIYHIILLYIIYIFLIMNIISYVWQEGGKAYQFDLIMDLATLGLGCGFNSSSKNLEFEHYKSNMLSLCFLF